MVMFNHIDVAHQVLVVAVLARVRAGLHPLQPVHQPGVHPGQGFEQGHDPLRHVGAQTLELRTCWRGQGGR